MKAPKKQVSYRLPETTIKGLQDIAKRHKISQADVIAVLVRAVQEGIEDIRDLDEHFDIIRLG